MKNRLSVLLPALGLILSLSHSASAWAEDGRDEIKFIQVYPKDSLAIGLMMINFTGSARFGLTISPSLEWTKRFADSRFNFPTRISPVLRSDGGLVGIFMGFGVGYRLLGNFEQTSEIRVGNQTLAEHSQDSSTFELSTELFMDLFPVFGSSTTVFYAGPGVGLRVRVNTFLPLTIGVRTSRILIGTDATTTLTFFAGYTVNL